jgi:phosphoribosylanthranilate isomerase
MLSPERISALFDRGGLVKIDGLREPEHAAAAAEAGADLIGFIFAPARRRVTPLVARDCIVAARQVNRERPVVAVGVFVDAPADEIQEAVDAAGLDLAQLHGAEPTTLVEELRTPAIKVLRSEPGVSAEAMVAAIDEYRIAARAPVAFLIDGFAPGTLGGAGARADWSMAAAVCAERAVLLGGGLDPTNVEEAIRRVRPIGVDVSSGVERDGVKDAALIASFVRAARAAFQEGATNRPARPEW